MRCVVAILVSAGLVSAAGDPASGPQVGDKLGTFKAKAVTGGDAGKEFQFPGKSKDGPTLIIFVQKFSRPAFKLLKPIDEFAGGKEGLAAQVVWVTGDVEKTEEYLKKAQNSLKMQMPLSVCLDGKDGPMAYGLNDQAAITILVAKDRKVVANFAYADPNENDAPKVIEALKKALPKP
jgi:hypothetical protein